MSMCKRKDTLTALGLVILRKWGLAQAPSATLLAVAASPIEGQVTAVEAPWPENQETSCLSPTISGLASTTLRANRFLAEKAGTGHTPGLPRWALVPVDIVEAPVVVHCTL